MLPAFAFQNFSDFCDFEAINRRGVIRIYDEAREGETVTELQFEQAVSRIRNGDKDGLKDIYLAYVKFIYAVIYEIIQNKESTEDVTSEFFIKLWDVAERYVPGHGHRGFLATIARNMAIDYVRRRRREVLVADPDTGVRTDAAGNGGFARSGEGSPQDAGGSFCESDAASFDVPGARGMPPGTPGAAARPVEDEAVGNMALKEALAVLKDGERQIIHMKILGEMTFQEISDTLHMPMGTVTWKYRSAIGKLRRCGYEQESENGI